MRTKEEINKELKQLKMQQVITKGSRSRSNGNLIIWAQINALKWVLGERERCIR